MDRVPKTEPGSSPFIPGSSPPVFASTSPRNLRDMSVSELVAVLRPAFRAEDYDKVEEVLESKYEKLQGQVEMERLERMHLEEQLRQRNEEFDKGKNEKENYEMLLKIMKEAGGLASGGSDSHCIDEMKKKIGELEAENFELKEMKKKLVDDVVELRKKNVELVCENYEMNEMKEKWVDDSSALAELRIRVRVLEDEKFNVHDAFVAVRRKNSELEEGWRKNLVKLEELRAENCKLEEEKRRMKREFGELNRRLAGMEDDMKLLMSVETGGGNIEGDSPAGYRANEEVIGVYEFGGTVKRNEDPYYSLGGVTSQSSNKGCKDAGGGIEKLENDDKIINLDDSDDHADAKKALSGIRIKSDPPSSFVEVQQKSTLTKEIELLKRKLPFTVYSSCTGSSSDEELDVDNLPLSFVRNKRS
ncbi:uncharacterized protein LOC130731505 [Lotus japonicus]|uniref:uncharacterized protein LOC130731505 n=1 Tax=Lotus japonicus TaxID=34305 RepID=UPI002588821F|nr:uncharacterized protein LOC130731505 [Lotus japonicus]